MSNPIINHILAALLVLAVLLALCAVATYCTGCSVNAADVAIDDMDERDEAVQLAAIERISKQESKRSCIRLIEAFEDNASTREEVAKALVRRGREFYTEHPNSRSGNLVVVKLGELAARADLNPSIRAKAVWVMAEVGDRAARGCIEGAYAGDSVAVGEEVGRSLDKLGFTVEAHEMELLADGYTTASGYDPEARGHIEEAE